MKGASRLSLAFATQFPTVPNGLDRSETGPRRAITFRWTNYAGVAGCDTPHRVSPPQAPAICSRLIVLSNPESSLRYATTGHGDIKPLRGRPGDFRLRVGKWRVFFRHDEPDLVLVIGIDNRGEAY